MNRPRVVLRSLLAATSLLCALPALAAGKLDAQYTISFAGISVGKATWTVDIGPESYEAVASGGASGMVRAIASGEGTLTSRGAVKDGRPVPATFVSSITRDDDKSALRVTFEDGKAIDIVGSDPNHNRTRVPVTDVHRQGVLDPIAALLLPASGAELGAAACQRTLHIFDGKHRFDLKLSFRRMDKVKADKGYAGPAVVCTVVFEPIAGHRPESRLVKYLSDKRDIEAWYVPIAGAPVLAPFKLTIAGMLGNVVIQASEFGTGAPAQRAAVRPDQKAQ